MLAEVLPICLSLQAQHSTHAAVQLLRSMCHAYTVCKGVTHEQLLCHVVSLWSHFQGLL